MRKTPTATLGVALAATMAATGLAAPAAADDGGTGAGTREVLFVGNNWDGTVDVISPDRDLEHLGTINAVPDLDRRMREIRRDPVRYAYFLGIRELIGEGNDQLVDDMYTTPDGTTLIVSRPSLADVIGIDVATGEPVWRFEVDGQRSDHMALSPDGEQVAVSASTANTVHLLDVYTGEEEGTVPTGDQPHENVYTADGERLVNASIGTVYTPLDEPWQDWTKGERYVQIADRDTNEVIERVDMGRKLEEAGYPDMSSSVRPMTFSPDERFLYFQVSFFHGFVEYDTREDRVTRVVELPIAEDAQDMPRWKYPLDSAHHGISMNTEGTKLCVAGTVSDYATIVARDTFEHQGLVHGGEKPYWATRGSDGEYCFVSWSGTDSVSAISYTTGAEVNSVKVGDHPQRMRLGALSEEWFRD